MSVVALENAPLYVSGFLWPVGQVLGERDSILQDQSQMM